MKPLLAALFLALALPAAAAAHASLVRTEPANGAVLAHAPRAVRIVFDDTVRRGPGIAVVRNGGGSVLAGDARVLGGRTLVLPLRRLARGAYTVRWAIVSDDGHLESGVLAFAVGAGQPRPVASLGAEATGPRPEDVIARWLFLAGVLTAVGTALFGLVAARDDGRLTLLLASGAAVAALGAADEAHRVGLSTRAGTALVAGSVYAVVVALVAAAATLEPRALLPSFVAALPLVAVPTTSGHALDRGLSRINVPADLLHVAGASAWVGALLGLAVTRRRELRLVLAGVGVLALTGLVRAGYELLHVSQAWDTAYGRTLLVKTGVLLLAVALGVWRRPRVELVLVAVLVGAVAVLVLQRPGRNQPPAVRAAAVPAEPSPAPPAPPPGAIVDAAELGVYGVALASEPSRLTAIVLSPAGGGADGLDVQIDGRDATPCGHGCYHVDGQHRTAVPVAVGGRRVWLRAYSPRLAVPARDQLRIFERFFRSSRSVVYVERLASSPTNVVVARWRLERPDRFSYAIRGGPQAIVIGARRWDRNSPRGRWRESAQTQSPQPNVPWARATNVWFVSAHHIVFVDPTIPAYFDLEWHDLPTRLTMVAAAHFMSDSYVSFGRLRRLRAPR